jgi:hypothetical protein
VFFYFRFLLRYSTGREGGEGWTAYNRGGVNVLQVYLPLFFQQAVICLSRVNLTISWERAPLAISFAPKLGPLSGGTLVNISGFNFDVGAQYVFFNCVLVFF